MVKRDPKEFQKRSSFLRVIGPILCGIFSLYLSHQIFRFAGFSPWISALGVTWVFLVVFWILFIVIRFILNPDARETKSAIRYQISGHLAQGYFSYLLFVVFLRDLTSLIGFFFQRELFYYNQTEAYFILAAPPFLMALGRLVVLAGPFTRKVIIRRNGLHKDLRGLRIVQISDMHIGPGVSLAKMQDIVKKVNRLNADLVVLTGDIVDHLDHWFVEEIAELANFKSRYGTFFVPGNHEYYWGFTPIIEAIRRLKIPVLLNENIQISIGSAKLAVCGVPDISAKYFSLEAPDFGKTLRGAENCDFKLLLSHQPKTADEACRHPYDLQLSGHTHGGQFIPWSLIIRLFQKYTTGIFILGKMTLYVSRGTGYWGPPDRLGTYGEISCIILETDL